MDPFKYKRNTHLTAGELRESVLQTKRLNRKWLKEYTKPTKLSAMDYGESGLLITNDMLRQRPRCFVSEHFLISAAPGNVIEAYCLQNGSRLLSAYQVKDNSSSNLRNLMFTLWDSNLYFTDYDKCIDEAG